MAKEQEMTTKEKIVDGLTRFLQKYKYFLLAILAAALIIIIVIGITSSIREKRIAESTRLAEQLEETYNKWASAEEGSDQKDEIESKIIEQAEDIYSKYGSLYAAQRAHLIEGTLYFNKENWENAAESFEFIVNNYPNSYLAPIALMNKAIALEQNAEIEEAIAAYSVLVDKYSDTSLDTAHAIFSIGRLQEEQGTLEEARETYRSLVERYPNNNWTNLARNRIIYLNSGL